MFHKVPNPKRLRNSLLILSSICWAAGCAKDQPSQRCAALPDNEMVWVKPGTFVQGEHPHYKEEGPPKLVPVSGFWMSSHEVTNVEFARFIAATGYVTIAERPFSTADGQVNSPAGSAVFRVPTPQDEQWWHFVPGASWRHPAGPGSEIEGADREPVVHIAFGDALAYARWRGLDLPTEKQWEYAARGGEDELPSVVTKSGTPSANYYQGVFPVRDTAADGFASKSPVGCFDPNAFGLYDMIGNVWEWTTDVGTRAGSVEEVGVIKGGSYLCAANYCARYRPAARQFQERSLGTDHIGFRLVDNNKPAPDRKAGD